jgi:hypothetical protein
MSLTREPIYLALWNKVRVIPGFNTVSRRLAHWADVPKSQQPALYQAQAGEMAMLEHGIPTRWHLSVNLYLYVVADEDPYASPAPMLNALLDAVEAAVAPDYSGYQTLGGLVYDCKINGKIETLEGVLGGQEVAIVPIEIQLHA